jgi:purine-binding chemotaxis protein CheW
MSEGTDARPLTQYLTFEVASEEYAIPLLAVREIIQYEAATKVPHTPEWIHGLINLRGLVVAVVDLSIKFVGAPTVPASSTCIVIVEVSHAQQRIVLGVLADAVHQVIELADSDIKPAPSFGTRVNVDFLRGVGMLENGLVLVLNVENVLLTEEKRVVGALGAGDPRTPACPEPRAAAG